MLRVVHCLLLSIFHHLHLLCILVSRTFQNSCVLTMVSMAMKRMECQKLFMSNAVVIPVNLHYRQPLYNSTNTGIFPYIIPQFFKNSTPLGVIFLINFLNRVLPPKTNRNRFRGEIDFTNFF